MTKQLVSLALILVVTACAQTTASQGYSTNAVGQVNRTIAAKVISAREVDISGTTGAGGGVGSALGAVGGSSIGSTGRDNLAGAIAGAVVGGVVGATIEGNATKKKGMEYVVETENGNLMTLVQGGSSTFTVGQKVLVLYGSPSRVIPDPRQQQP